MQLKHYCMDSLRRSPNKSSERLITEDGTIHIKFWMLCPVEEGQPLEVIDYEDGLVYVKVIEESIQKN